MDKKIELRIKTQQQQRLDITPGKQQKFTLGNSIPVPELDYEKLYNKPRINSVELIGNKSLDDLGIEDTDPLTNFEIEEMLANIFN